MNLLAASLIHGRAAARQVGCTETCARIFHMTSSIIMELVSTASVGAGLCVAGMVSAWFLLRGKTNASIPAPICNVPVAKVSKLYVYPVKSCHRIEVESINCLKRGLKYDRTFVLLDKKGIFMSQRGYPTMALVQPQIDLSDEKGEVSLFLNAPGMEEIEIKLSQGTRPTKTVKVWNLEGEGLYVGEEAGEWFSRYLGKEGCSLYYMSPQHKARVLTEDPTWTDITQCGDESSFSDFAPLLVASEASMELLNSKLDVELEIERFRPNIILTGCLAHAEDNWPQLRIGQELIIRKLKPCDRCKLPTVDQEKGVFSTGEPTQTLRKYRYHSDVYEGTKDSRFGSPIFGCHFAVTQQGTVAVNDVCYAPETVGDI